MKQHNSLLLRTALGVTCPSRHMQPHGIVSMRNRPVTTARFRTAGLFAETPTHAHAPDMVKRNSLQSKGSGGWIESYPSNRRTLVLVLGIFLAVIFRPSQASFNLLHPPNSSSRKSPSRQDPSILVEAWAAAAWVAAARAAARLERARTRMRVRVCVPRRHVDVASTFVSTSETR